MSLGKDPPRCCLNIRLRRMFWLGNISVPSRAKSAPPIWQFRYVRSCLMKGPVGPFIWLGNSSPSPFSLGLKARTFVRAFGSGPSFGLGSSLLRASSGLWPGHSARSLVRPDSATSEAPRSLGFAQLGPAALDPRRGLTTFDPCSGAQWALPIGRFPEGSRKAPRRYLAKCFAFCGEKAPLFLLLTLVPRRENPLRGVFPPRYSLRTYARVGKSLEGFSSGLQRTPRWG